MATHNPACERWWEDFVLQHGPASNQHTAFLGYLTTHQINPFGDVAELEAAQMAFLAWWQESTAPPATRQAAPAPSPGSQARPRG